MKKFIQEIVAIFFQKNIIHFIFYSFWYLKKQIILM